MDPELIDRLRRDLGAAGYATGGVGELLGASADAARGRGVFAPARRRAVARDGALALLVRLFLLGDSLEEAAVTTALPTLQCSGARQLGLIAGSEDGSYRAALSLNPVSIVGAGTAFDWWIISDLDDQLRRGPAQPDHVMGVGGATRSLIAQAPFGSSIQQPARFAALDLGTGCGIVALFIACALERGPRNGDAGEALEHRIVATDISERALMMARANARLNGVGDRIEFRRGDLFAPVAGERYDLILSNPPFVISPRGDDDAPVYEYRDGGLSGDALAERVIRQAPRFLAEGGTLLCLANWESPWGENGLARVRGWIEAAATEVGALDAWVIERDRVEPAQYAETWARDGGARPGSADFDRAMEAWLADFEARRIVAIGLGAVRLRRSLGIADGENVVQTEQAMGGYAAEDLGDGLAAAFDAGVRAERMRDHEVLSTTWYAASSITELREHQPGEEAPRSISLTVDAPIARRVSADPLIAAAIGVCDGDLTLGQIADALATILEVDSTAAAEALVSSARELAWLGMLSTVPR